MTDATRILVIKLGALGDFVQSLGPAAAIRRHHAGAEVTLLTTGPFVPLAEASGYFERVWVDDKPSWRQPAGWLRLRRRLRGGRFDRVYDLQTSDRSGAYFRLIGPGRRPEWSGIARGCSHPHANPDRDFMHTAERQAEQLAAAGIGDVPAPDLSWARADIGRFDLADRFVLLAPGGAAHRPDKRWPAERYGELARRLADAGAQPVLIGGPEEAALLRGVADAAPGARDLAGRTGIIELVALARAAAGAVGNDTGPMHAVAAAGCRAVVLYSHASDPALCAQRGPAVAILRRPRLEDLPVDDVAAALAGLGAAGPAPAGD